MADPPAPPRSPEPTPPRTGQPKHEPSAAFAPPATPIVVDPGWRRIASFVRTRLVRLLIGVAVWGCWISLVIPGTAWLSLGLGAVVGLVLWLPTTSLLARIVFFPGPVDPRILDASGRPIAPDDHRRRQRVLLAEHLLSSVPLGLCLVWMLLVGGAARVLGLALVLPVGLASVVQQLRAIRGVLLAESKLELALEQDDRALRALRWLVRLPGGRRDLAWQLLAIARHRTGDPMGALDALDRITEVERYEVDRLRREFTAA